MAEFSQEEKDNIEKEFEGILKTCPKCSKDKETEALVRKAFDIANFAHYGSRRKSGEPYILHPIEVAKIASSEIGLGATSVICALLHDVVEDTEITLDDISDMFGEKVAQIIDGLTKIKDALKTEAGHAENFKKIILTLADDVRVILLKIADRLHNMRTLESMQPEKQLRIAEETQNLFVPLAHRLGFYNIKMELEDLCLKYLQPTVYNDITKKLKSSEKKRVHYLNLFCLPIMFTLEQNGIKYNISSRSKSITSIWNKMQKQNIPFENVYDVFAVRIVLTDVIPSLEEEKAICWRVYSIITNKYKPNQQRLRDWISTPKDNGYESLHTTVMGPDGTWVEVQIRTERMNDIAERGYAAHWKYKNIDGYEKSQLEVWLERVRNTLKNPDADALAFLDDFKLNLYSNDLFAFTPHGDMKRFPVDATVLDFAYEIHREIGNHAIGAKINKTKTVALDYKLQSGDQVEILTTENQHPQMSWLNMVTTTKARKALQQVFKAEQKRLILHGQKMLQEMLQRHKMQETAGVLDKLIKGLVCADKNELYEKIANETFPESKIIEYATKKRTSKLIRLLTPQFLLKDEPSEEFPATPNNVLQISHDENPNYSIAQCCHPIPGDSVIAFKTDGNFVLHKSNCPQAVELKVTHKNYEVHWKNSRTAGFLVSIHLEGKDRIGILKDIVNVITEQFDINIRNVQIESTESKFQGTLDLYVVDKQHLNNLMLKLQKIRGVRTVDRVESFLQ
ncbi:MAG: RelA/SpoT family protein [Bacteroidales bacterium]|jgi:GTP pyrophosphokinase|nr:RelA/SpoT family protein [Bacteroidales bacterium]